MTFPVPFFFPLTIILRFLRVLPMIRPIRRISSCTDPTDQDPFRLWMLPLANDAAGMMQHQEMCSGFRMPLTVYEHTVFSQVCSCCHHRIRESSISNSPAENLPGNPCALLYILTRPESGLPEQYTSAYLPLRRDRSCRIPQTGLPNN